REPKVETGKCREQWSDRHDEMEMGDDKIGVLKLNVGCRRPEKDTAQAAAHKHRHESYGEQARCSETDTGTPDRAKPIKGLHRGWNSDQERGQSENRTQEWIHSADEHVVAPYNETQDRDRHHRVNHH